MMFWDQSTEKGIESRSKKSLASSLSHRGNDPGQRPINIKKTKDVRDAMVWIPGQTQLRQSLDTGTRKEMVRKGRGGSQHKGVMS